MPGSTQVPSRRLLVFAYGTVTLCGRLSHTFLLTRRFVELLCAWPYNPRKVNLSSLGYSHFARHYFGNDLFSSGYLDVSVLLVPLEYPIYSDIDAVGSQQRVSPFGNPRIGACSRLPEAYRSDPRPSSALGAKASTISP